ncbi:histidine kinase N-terminal 7TM domain-containing protein [Halobacterium salinarum]|uniref:sensor histidine kinase n=1 Tax=Halobacterium salinarum TaxID=2242 RepID=UPI00255240C8|nr:ATP-binding protein [Halobacterium salinarum]MDL0120048.1 histidine kinase N-terminal 7TM domain-containing protein [Halobacterium salinarum]MDL0127745.1 histidine kinase N-terminal 7TM domain-containing protein [Halobacterium salinarum]MDL0135988.1 histidine kinase N-terminal 7TM domain-containing protein [Halobacterium salinarum]MDL0140227.1 histidine kinase N-terminal 7TM domain-containing protein [Halobacterium salinarum]MDL0145187.1 histidine kinase N-terminal 7TM domain-containing pro
MAVLSASSLSLLYVCLFTVAALACFVSLTQLQRITDSDTRRGLWALLLTSGSWATAHVGFLVSPTTELKLGWYTFGLVVGLAAVGAWLYFCSAYTGRTYHQNPTYRRLAVVVYVVLVAVKVTNPLHHAYFTTTAVATPFPHLSVYTGPLHWTVMGLSYALAFVGYFMLLELFTQIDLDTRALFALVGITGLPVVFDLVGYTTPFLIDITYEPVGVAVFAVGVAFVYIDQFDAVQLAGERDVPVIALDADNHIRDTNRAARTLFPNLDGTESTHLETILPRVADCLDSDEPILKMQQEGSIRYYRVTEAPYGTTEAGLGRTIVLTDVTDREMYRGELERQNERLERFASLVSHDLRNPLNVATGRFELLREEEEITANTHAEAVDRALTRMDDLIEQTLTLAREGKPVDQWDAVSLSSVASGCWKMVETNTAELRVADDLEFKAGPTRLQRLFENLFRNALDHGGPDVTVTVGALPDQAGFYISDDGPGIPESDRDSVFDLGYTTREEGTGFGLAIVDEMVAAHGWGIEVTEGDVGGARFEITGIETVA